MRVATGLCRLASDEHEVVKLVRGRRIGLLAHPASVDSRLRHAEDIVRAAGAELSVLFGPEHGYTGRAQDMIGVTHEAPVQVPVVSLYGATFDELSPTPEALAGLDAVVIDLQDVGSRYYTFVWSAALMLIACARQGVQVIVLDRPNPLDGVTLEGAPQRGGYRSFVGLYDVAVRHGMTVGEICTMVRELEGLVPEALEVVKMHGFQREMMWGDTGCPWVLPSPNMPTPDTATVYPGGCLLEGTNLSEGRGTTRPFEIFGAPFVDGVGLAREIQASGAMLRPLSFEPTFHKHARTSCGGVQVHVDDPRAFRSYALYLRAIAAIAKRAPDEFRFRTETYEYVSDRPAIDLLTGGSEFRACVEQGADLEDVLRSDEQGTRGFAERRKPWLLY